MFDSRPDADPVAICREAVKYAELNGYDTVLLDTAGRLHVDAPLMEELSRIKTAVDPGEILLVADAMTGQDAVNVAKAFHEKLALTGVVLTKADGDARGGAALSIRAVTGAPVKFVGTGEKLDALEPFHPERMASRILGMGDLLTFVEKAQDQVDEKQAKELERKLRKNEFTLEDFREQLRTIRKMGPLESILGMLPGMGNLKQLADQKPDEKQLNRVEAIIGSMTPAERRRHDLINGSRRKRIAKGSGTSVEDVNRLLKQFNEMKKVLQMIGQGGMAGMKGMKGMPKLPAMPGGGGFAAPGKKRKKGGPRGLIKAR